MFVVRESEARVIELVDNRESHHDGIDFALATGPEKKHQQETLAKLQKSPDSPTE
jgi:hypothetical protein